MVIRVHTYTHIVWNPLAALSHLCPSEFVPFFVVQGKDEEDQKSVSLLESQHHHLLHCLEKTTVSA